MSLGVKETTEVLETLQRKGDHFTRLTATQRKHVTDVQEAIVHINKEIARYKASSKEAALMILNSHVITPNPAYKKTDGVNVGHEAQLNTTKILHINEAKLNRLLQKKSEIMIQIKKLKGEINHMRRLRCQTDIQHEKFEMILQDTKRSIERLLLESTKIVEERDKLLDKKAAYEKMNIDEQKSFREEYERMGNFIREQNELLEEALIRERRKDVLERKGVPDDTLKEKRQGQLTFEEELRIAQEVGELTKFVDSDENRMKGITTKIAEYEEIFDQLKKMTGATSMEDVITTYVAQEEEMFSLYNFIQNVNSEIDTVLESTATIEQSIGDFKSEQVILNEQRRNVVKDLEDKLAHYNELIKGSETEIKVCMESISQIAKKVSSLFFKLQCEQMDNVKTQPGGGASSNASTTSGGPNKKSLTSRSQSNMATLSGQTVSESNVLEYMGCIENRAVDIIAEYTLHEPGKHNIRASAGPGSPVRWSVDPLVDFNESVEEKLIATIENKDTLNSVNNQADEVDNKPVDLQAFKKNILSSLELSTVREVKDAKTQRSVFPKGPSQRPGNNINRK